MAYNETPTKGHAMFLDKRELRIRVAKTDSPENASETTVVPFEDPEQLNRIATEFVRNAAIALGCILVLGTALYTISEVIIKSVESKDEQ